MAEILIGVIAEGILYKALSIASEEITHVWGLKEDTKLLAKKLQMMQALLCDAENKHLINSAAVQLWMKRLEDVALDADNVLDEFTYESVRRKVEIKNSKRNKVRNFFSSSNPLAFRHKMAAKIKNINLMLDELYQEGNGIGLRIVEFMNSSVEFNDMLKTGPFVDDSEIVGRTGDVSSLVHCVVTSTDEKDLPVISIVGMPGQGKTTLAQLVYKDDKVVRHFDYRLWICVSDNFTVDRILNEMVEATMQTYSNMTNREAIVKKLREKLNNKKFFLVLDDVWNENQAKWNCLKKCLLEIGGSSGSKIMVTTRSEDVALTMQACITHRLDTLSVDETWSLFKQVAFADGGAIENPTLISIGKRILKRCGGVPLAIKALGGLLYSRKDENEWLVIERSELWGLSMNENGVLPTLRLSYNHLPFLPLKQCFGYCSLFQKDSIMEKDKLIQLWMAQGFLNHSKENHLEMDDIGSNFLNILLRNSLLQVDKNDDYGNVRTCKMHDLVHDLALDVSKNYCLTLDGEEVTREICVVNLSLVSSESLLAAIPNETCQRLRTFFCVASLLGDTLIKYKKLRALILNCKDHVEFPGSIGNLKHLRYLDVSKTKIFSLPDTITKLYNLQTLRLYSLEKLPKEFGNLINLRHFYIEKVELSDKKKCLLPGMGQLKCLRTIPYFIVSHEEGCQINELVSLNNLRGTLKIYGLGNIENGEEAGEANIEGKLNIDTLEYEWSSRGEEAYYDPVNDEDVLEGLRPHSNIKGIKIEGFHDFSFPSWMMSPSCIFLLRNLVKIILKFCNRCEQIPPLGCLPCLKIVEIELMESVSYIGSEFYGSKYLDFSGEVTVFPSLKRLSLWGITNLVEWWDLVELYYSVSPVKVLPQLEDLEVGDCSLLTRLPDMTLSSLKSLRKLKIFSCCQLAYLPEELGLLESLEELSICRCPSLVKIPDIHGLQSLRKLFIQFCKNLTCLPEGLQTLKSLVHLCLVSCPNVVIIPDVRRLQSLRDLTIEYCENLSALPNGLEFCTTLWFLNICGCPILLVEDLHRLQNLRKLLIGPFSEDLDYFPWTTISSSERNNIMQHSLTSVDLRGWPKLTALPEQLQFYALTCLVILDFKGLVALPEWLGNIKSLQTICIWHCENLMYFPSADTMQSLNNLQKVEIESCPLLEARCAQGTRPEWHKIAHIPEISINAYSNRS